MSHTEQELAEWVRHSELSRALRGAVTRAGTLSAAFAMVIALALPWMRWPKVAMPEDDRLLFELSRAFESRYELQDATFLRVAALVAVVATVICLVGSWRGWDPRAVSLAPGLAVVVLVLAFGYVDLFTAYISGDVGFYATFAIQLGLFMVWWSAARPRSRR